MSGGWTSLRNATARTVWLVARKELLEAMRDRRTLFVALVLPVLLYPLVMLGVAPIISAQRKKLLEDRQPIALTGEGADAVRTLVLEPSVTEADPEPEPVGLEVIETDDAEAALAAGEIALWIDVDAEFRSDVFSDKTGHITLRRDSSEDSSIAAYQKWREALIRAEERLLEARMIARDLDPGFRDPIKAEVVDVATAERRGAYVLGKMLALILVVMTLSSSFYPAVDMVAGEKERGTMETLLVAPCGRAELVLGKFIAVLVVTLAAAILNLVSMGLTMGPLVGGLGIEGVQGIGVSWQVAGGILLLLIPLSALFSALSLTLSTMARSVKEAQHYLTPMFLLVMPLAMVVVIPNIPLSKTVAAIPITNVVLFFRDLMLGKIELATTLITFATTVVAAGLALYVSVTLFLREETLFRGPEGTGSLISRPEPAPTPRAPSAVFLFAAALAIIWYAQPLLPTDDFVAQILITQFGIILAPCLALAWWLKVDWKKTFQIRVPRWSTLALAIPVGLTVPVVNAWLQRGLFGTDLPVGPMRELAERMVAMMADTHPGVLFLLMAALPGLVEELVFRGFILSSFRSTLKGRRAVLWAVVLTAVFFGLFHLYPEKWLSTALTGLVLGLLAVAGRSIWPAVLAHVLNNGLLVLSDTFPVVQTVLDPTNERYGAALGFSAAILAFGLSIVVLQARSASSEDPSDEAPPEPPA